MSVLAWRSAMAALYWARLPRRDDAAILGSVAGLSGADHRQVSEILGSGALNGLSDMELLTGMARLAAKTATVAKTAPVEYLGTAVVTAPAGTGEFTGYAATWTDDGGPDRQGDVIRRGAFAASVAAINTGARAVPVLAGEGHQDLAPDRVVGRVVEAREDNVGLWVRAVYAADAESQTIRAKVAAGGLSMSVFGPILNSRPAGGGRELLAVDLVHVLLTTIPANPSAIIMTAKAEPAPDVDGMLAEMETWARAENAEAVLASMADNPEAMAETAGLLLDARQRDQMAELETWAATARVPSEAEVRAEAGQVRREVDNRQSWQVWQWQREHAGHRRCRTGGECDV